MHRCSLADGDKMAVELSRGCIDRIKSGELANEPVTVQVGSRLALPLQRLCCSSRLGAASDESGASPKCCSSDGGARLFKLGVLGAGGAGSTALAHNRRPICLFYVACRSPTSSC